MNHRLLFFSLIFAPLMLQAHPTGKTFFSQSISPTWMHPLSLFNAEKNRESRIHIEPFYWSSSCKETLGTYFGYYQSTTDSYQNNVSVDADATNVALRPQDILHDATHASSYNDALVNPLSETISFYPEISHYGITIANSMSLNDWLSVDTIMPWIFVTHRMNFVSSNINTQLVEGFAKTVTNFFEGNITQEDAISPNQQDRLIYGKFKNRQSCSGLGDITFRLNASLTEKEAASLHIGTILTLPTGNRATGHYLFEPLLGTGGHTVCGAFLQGSHIFNTINGVTVSGLFSLTHRIGLSNTETRSPSFQYPLDTGIDAYFARYALAGKQNTRRLFPLISLLTQTVSVSPGSATDFMLGIQAQYKGINGALSYQLSHTQKETITPLTQWPNDLIGLSRFDYAQSDTSGETIAYHTFDTATNSIVTGPLKDEDLLYSAAETPAQTTHSLHIRITGSPFTKWPHTRLSLQSSYTFSLHNSFGIDGFGMSIVIGHTF